MNNQGIVNEDRISELPDALLVKILSLLPTEKAVATSVLSKQWQSLWKLLPKLNFDSFYHRGEFGTYSKNVRKALLSHKALVLQRLHLIISSKRCNAMDTGILIGIAVARNVRELVLFVTTREGFIFPKSLCNSETLETLELKCSALMDVPSLVSLKSLRTLDLFLVGFKDDESVVNLLSGCPKLENLVVRGIECYNNVKTFTIAVPSLQRLSIYTDREVRLCFVINAPSLKYLIISGVRALDSCLIENVPELVEANIYDVSPKMINEKLTGSLTSVKRICLSLQPVKNKFPTGVIFYQLVYLEIHTYRLVWWNLLTLMLDSSPKLRVLKLSDQNRLKIHLPACCKWNQPKTVPECLLLHLETFMWKFYEWKRIDHEIEVAKYILSNASCLKRATFSSKRITHKERVEMLEELESVARASNSSCQLVFK